MKLVIGEVNRLLGFTILFGVMAALMISTIPAAMANPGSSPGAVPDPGAKNSIVYITVVTIPRGWVDEVVVYDTATAPTLVGNICPLEIPSGIKAWKLVSDTDSTKNIRAFLAPGGVGKIAAPFGTGVGSPITVTATGGAFVTKDGSVPPTTAGLVLVQATWLEVGDTAGTPPPSTDRVGQYRVGACGKEGVGTYVSASDYELSSPFEIINPVGGEIIPVSTTALLLAGVSTSALWLVPLAAIATGAFVVLRFQVNKK